MLKQISSGTISTLRRANSSSAQSATRRIGDNGDFHKLLLQSGDIEEATETIYMNEADRMQHACQLAPLSPVAHCPTNGFEAALLRASGIKLLAPATEPKYIDIT